MSEDDPLSAALVSSVSWLMIGMTLLLAAALCVQMYFDPQHKPDAALTGMLGLLVGAIAQNYGQAFSYKFGSTSQSKIKDETIHTMATSAGVGNDTQKPLKVDVVGTPDNPPDDKP